MTDPADPPEDPPRGALARIVAAHRREALAARDRSPALSRAWTRALRHAGAPFKALNLTVTCVDIAEHVALSDALGRLPPHGLLAALPAEGLHG